MADISQCPAAILIKQCRQDETLKQMVSAGEVGLLAKHILENERAWTEVELYGSSVGSGTDET